MMRSLLRVLLAVHSLGTSTNLPEATSSATIHSPSQARPIPALLDWP